MKFNHLNVPEHWQHYWSRYPEGYTILEALISWVSQVDDMVDNQNALNETVKDYQVGLDDFIERFDSRLQEEVTKTLNEWQVSGFLDVVIDEALQTEMDNLDTKVTERLNLFKEQLAESTDFNNSRFSASTFKITSNNQYTAWPQDKCFTLNNVIYVLYNSGGYFHSSNQLRPVMKRSYDGGMTFDEGTIISNNPSSATYPKGVISFGAGTDGEYIYTIVLYRGDSTAVGSYKHVLFYGLPTQHPSEWTQVEVNISKDGYVPNQFHSFASLADGSIAFGYNYLSGEVGIAKTFDKGVTWETHVMFTDEEMSNDINNCEATMYVEGSTVVGFLRAEGRDYSIKPKFWKSLDNCQTFTFEDILNMPFATPIPLTKVGNKFYAFQSERTGQGRAYLHEGDVQEVLSNGYSAFKRTFLGNLHHQEGSNRGGSGIGVGSLVGLNNDLFIYFSSEDSRGYPDIYQTIIKLDMNDNSLINLKDGVIVENPKELKTRVEYGHHISQTIQPLTPTQIMYKFKYTDALNEYDNVTGVFTAKYSGVYQFDVALNIGKVTDVTIAYIDVYKNGEVLKTITHSPSTPTYETRYLRGSLMMNLVYGDEISFYVYSSGSVLTTNKDYRNSYLSIFRVD